MKYFYVAMTLIMTVYGQIIIKWRINCIVGDNIKTGANNTVRDVLKILMDYYVLSGFFAAFIASLFWIVAMRKMNISVAYPFMSLAPVFVLIISSSILGESITPGKLYGVLFIITGIFISVNY